MSLDLTRVEMKSVKRRLILRDSFVFLGLISITLVLFLVTLFLFNTFSRHRVELGQRWYGRGQRDLASGDPGRAVVDLRTALGYEPEQKTYQLLLAQALSASGSVDEAFTYFSTLWEAQPGSGLLNLQLARLTAKMGRSAEAVHYYRAAIFGTWEGDGALRRREVRLELIRYLMANHDDATAQTELLIAAGNSTDDPTTRLEIAGLMVEAGEPGAALTQYEKILAHEPRNIAALKGAGTAAFQLGHYASALRFLEATERRDAVALGSSAQELLTQARAILEMFPAQDLKNSDRVKRVIRLRQISQNRWNGCQSRLPPNAGTDPDLAGLTQRWQAVAANTAKPGDLKDPQVQQDTIDLSYTTEKVTAEFCGAPQGEDALLLKIAENPGAVIQ